MEQYIKEKQIPHLLFHGPPGSGKTTLAYILMKSINCQSLTLNASSDDRGIATVKGKIKEFAGSVSLAGALKVVFLDEADGLTPDAQMALKNTIEVYSKSCRFILTANNIHKIVEAIRSRPTIYEFSQIDKSSLMERLEEILEAEDVEYEDDDVKSIVDRYFPDVRTITNNLQAATIDGTLDPAAAGLSAVSPESLMAMVEKGNLKAIRAEVNGLPDFTYIYRWIFDEYLPTLDTEEGIELSSSLVKHLYQDAIVADRFINFLGFCVDSMDIFEVKEITF